MNKEQTAQDDGWLIHKDGRGWYRPDASGYTSNPAEAGRYNYYEALRHSYPNGKTGPRDGIKIFHEHYVPNAAAPSDPHLLRDALEALKIACEHLEHMAAFISNKKTGYSFESLGEDMPGIVAVRERARKAGVL